MNRLKFIIGTGLGSGYSRFAPGTFGSLMSMPFIWLTGVYLGWIGLVAFILITSALTLWVSPFLEEQWGKDPGKVVLDEWAGQAVCFLFIPLQYLTEESYLFLGAAFILFRFFDILKPLGIKKLQKLEGGWGILADDLLAGLYALICLNILIFYDVLELILEL